MKTDTLNNFKADPSPKSDIQRPAKPTEEIRVYNPNKANQENQIALSPYEDMVENDTKKSNPRVFKQNALLNTLAQNGILQFLPELANWISILGNSASSFANMIPVTKKLKNLGTKLGDLGTKAFLYANGITNTVEQLNNKNYLSAFGYFLENVVAAFVDQSKVFLARGFVAGPYTLANALTQVTGRSKFSSFGDHLQHIGEGLRKSGVFLAKDFFGSLKSSKTGLLSTLSGIMMLSGSVLWKLTGMERLGATFRDFGGLMQDVEQIKPGHRQKKPNYYISGWGVTLGTIFDYWSKWQTNLKGALVPLSLLFDGIGRYFLRRAQNSGELEINATHHEEDFLGEHDDVLAEFENPVREFNQRVDNMARAGRS